MTNSQIKASTIISVELFRNTIESLILSISNQSKLRNQVQYNNDELNNSFKKSFSQITEVLQSVVDSFYWDYYEVNEFQPFNVESLDSDISHNLSILRSAQKLTKFIQ